MRYLSIFTLIIFFAFPASVSAHGSGLIPFFKIDGKLAPAHPIQKENIVPASFTVAQDLPDEKFVVHQPITFLVDTTILSQVYSDDILRTIRYTWDYGNGDKAEGTQNTYTYNNIGSYTLTISAEFTKADIRPQVIETVQMDILPNKQYILAKPRIIVNDTPLRTETLKVNMLRPVIFKAEIINKHTAQIASYQWDLGEGDTASTQQFSHKYATTPYLIPPVVKVTDTNGFVTYAFGLLASTRSDKGTITLPLDSMGFWILVLQGFLLVSGGILFFILLRKKRVKGNKHT